MFGLEKIFSSAPKSILGVDVGTTSIKIAQLEKGKNNPRLVNYGLLESYGHFERANNVIQANSLKISEKDAMALLKILLGKVKFSTRDALASIPAFAAFVTLVEMPQMNDEETRKAMAFQLKQSVPLPLSEIAVDWINVGERDDENGFTKQQILIIAIPNETIAKYKSIFKGVGLSLRALEIENLACARAIVGADTTSTIIVDIGARSTSLSVLDQGFLKYASQIDYAGDTLTQSVVKGLGISYRRAEELKKQRGLSGGMGEYELSTLQTPFVDAILQEVVKVKDHVTRALGITVARVLLVGGGSNLIGLEEYANQQLGVPTALGNGLLYVAAPSEASIVSRELGTRFATAIGLGIKNFI